ncbi:MAG: hypothetical protein CFK52_00265 [Chloracidobacterium sp. CP2_5A]|nr:MAG: hypothetical protein CFK52_00265 [Chloracidobacterium sp. CP2_5A]
MRDSVSRLPFPPIAALAVAALVGLVLGLTLTSQSLPDLSLLDPLDRPANAALAQDIFIRQTGHAPPAGLTLQLIQIDQPTVAALCQHANGADLARLIRQSRLPAVIDHVVWFRPNGSLAACIGFSSVGDLAIYLNGDARAAADKPPTQDIALSQARAFLATATGVSPTWLGNPQIEQVTGQPETEVRWQQPLPELPELTRVVIVRLRGETVWYFQHRIQPTANDWARPFNTSVFVALLSLPPYLALLIAAVVYLFKTSRRHAILWRAPTVCAAVAGIASITTLVPLVPFSVSKALFENPVADSAPAKLDTILQSPRFLIFVVGAYAVSSLLTVVLSMVTAWVVCAALLHIEYDAKRACTEVFRAVLLLRRVPYTTTLQRGLIGGATGWALLGFSGAVYWLTADTTASIRLFNDNIAPLLDAWSPNLFAAGTLLRNTLEQSLVLVAFAWAALTDWLRLPPRLAWVAVALLGGVTWTDPFALVTPPSFETPWLFARNAAVTVALAATFERFGLWTTLCAVWAYQGAGLAIVAATFPVFGFSPWLPALLVPLPLAAVILTWRPPESERDNQPTLLDRVAEEQRHARQLALAARIQASFLPAGVPRLDGWEIAAFSLPAREVGGDFYDFFHGSAGRLGVFVGDVSGKSVPGALFAAVATTAFRSEAEEDELGCAAMLARLNELLHPDMKRVRMFVAAAYVQLELQSGVFTAANAGLPALACWRHAPRQEESSVEFLEAGGLPLGSMRRATYEEVQDSLRLEGQECLVITSDGIVEALNEQGEVYGYEALASVMRRHARRGAQALCDAIVSDVKRHMGNAEQSDDITIIVIQRRPRRLGAPAAELNDV